MTKKYEIIIDEGTAKDSSVIVNINETSLVDQREQDAVITEAISQNVIKTHDVRWISTIHEIK